MKGENIVYMFLGAFLILIVLYIIIACIEYFEKRKIKAFDKIPGKNFCIMDNHLNNIYTKYSGLEPKIINSEMDITFTDTDRINKICNNIHKDLIEQRDKAIIKILKDKGYSFDNTNEQELFLKNRCGIVAVGDQNILYVDNTPVISWHDRVEITEKDDKFIIIYNLV